MMTPNKIIYENLLYDMRIIRNAQIDDLMYYALWDNFAIVQNNVFDQVRNHLYKYLNNLS